MIQWKPNYDHDLPQSQDFDHISYLQWSPSYQWSKYILWTNLQNEWLRTHPDASGASPPTIRGWSLVRIYALDPSWNTLWQGSKLHEVEYVPWNLTLLPSLSKDILWSASKLHKEDTCLKIWYWYHPSQNTYYGQDQSRTRLDTCLRIWYRYRGLRIYINKIK